jgi:hypothetical protein
LPESSATWEDASFIQKVFPEFTPWGQVVSQQGGIVRTDHLTTWSHHGSLGWCYRCRWMKGEWSRSKITVKPAVSFFSV